MDGWIACVWLCVRWVHAWRELEINSASITLQITWYLVSTVHTYAFLITHNFAWRAPVTVTAATAATAATEAGCIDMNLFDLLFPIHLFAIPLFFFQFTFIFCVSCFAHCCLALIDGFVNPIDNHICLIEVYIGFWASIGIRVDRRTIGLHIYVLFELPGCTD